MNNSNTRITVVFPSNRYHCIKEILEKCIFPYIGRLFIFEIHDSSEDCQMEKFILNHAPKQTSIRYFKYPSDITADDKAIRALSQIKTDYSWLMGDGNLVDFNKIEEVLIKEQFEEYVVIDMESIVRIGHMGQDKECQSEHIYKYTNIPIFAMKYFSHLTYWGAPLVKMTYYHKVYKNGVLKKYRDKRSPWWIACTLFDQLASSVIENEKICVGVVYTKFIKSNIQKKDHWWSEDERYYDYTFRKFNLGIYLLPPFYSENVKKNIIKNFRKDALVSDFYLIHLRAIDNLQLKMLQEYKNDIAIIPKYYEKMYLYHLLPRSIAQILDFIKEWVKPLYFKIKRGELL